MSQCRSVQYCMVYLLAPPLVEAIQVSTQFLFYCFIFLCFFTPVFLGPVLHLKVQDQSEYQSPRKNPDDEGAGKNHERLKKSPSLPGKHILEEEENEFLSPQRCQRRALRGNVFTYRGSFKREQQKVSSFLLYCDGSGPFLVTSRYENFKWQRFQTDFAT